MLAPWLVMYYSLMWLHMRIEEHPLAVQVSFPFLEVTDVWHYRREGMIGS